MSEPSFPEIHEQSEELILESLNYSNAEPSQELQPPKPENKTAEILKSAQVEENGTALCEENLTNNKPDCLQSPFKKIKDNKNIAAICEENLTSNKPDRLQSPFKKIKEANNIAVTEKLKIDENADNTCETSFPEMLEESQEGSLKSPNCPNPEPKQKLKKQKKVQKKVPKKTKKLAKLETLNENETETCEENLKKDVANLVGFKKIKDTKYGVCPYCGVKYTHSSLSLHIRRHTGEKPYKCDMCEKAFVELHDLKRHKRMHTGERPHVCPTCGKAFAQKNKLSRHQLVHTGERPHKCLHCDKSFTQKNELNLHIRRHTGDRPYMCGICGESFITGTLLRNHQKSVSHFEEDNKDRFIKIRVSNPSRSYRSTGSIRIQEMSD